MRDRREGDSGGSVEVARNGGEALERLRAVEPAVGEEELVQARQHAPCLVLRPGCYGPLGRDPKVVDLAS